MSHTRSYLKELPAQANVGSVVPMKTAVRRPPPGGSYVSNTLCNACVRLPLLSSYQALAQVPSERSAEMTPDRFVSGERAAISEPVGGDLISAGREVVIESSTNGDVLAAGRQVRIAGNSHQDVYAAGGEVRIAGVIDRNARLAGGTVLLEETAKISGNASLAGGEIRALGNVGGYLQLAGGEIYLNGPVQGNVIARARRIEVGPNADIAGTLRYSSSQELSQAPGAKIGGGVERLPGEYQGGSALFSWGFWAWSIGLIVLGIALLAVLPRFSRRVTEAVRLRFGRSLLVGLAAFILMPMAAAATAITIVGLPISIVLLLSYFVLLLVSFAFTGIALGDASLRWLRPDRQDSRPLRVLGAATALLLLALLMTVPILGGMIALVALIVGMGALLYQIRRGTPAAA
jgi:hypothetical protein